MEYIFPIFTIIVVVALVFLAILQVVKWKKKWRKLGRLFGTMQIIFSNARKGKITKPEADRFFCFADEVSDLMLEKPFVNDKNDIPRIKDEISKMSHQISMLSAVSAPRVSLGDEIDKLASLRQNGLITDIEFKAFSERFGLSTGEKANSIINAISKLSEQHKQGAMAEGNYHAALWGLLDKLDRRT